MRTTTARRGFTIAEFAAILLVGGSVTGMLSATDPFSRARETGRQLKDATQIRGTHQAMVMWATQNNGRYPLPSLVDRAGLTIGTSGAALDTTANIMSMMVWNGSVPADLLISPVETNKAISQDEDFQYDAPEAATTPERALWDPAFDADFTDGKGNMSYAHLLPGGERLDMWRDTFASHQTIYMTRGPQVTAATPAEDGAVTPSVANGKSNTLDFFLSESDTRGNSWSTNIAFNDNRVMFWADRITRPHAEAPFGPVALRRDGYWLTMDDNTRRTDLLTFDEPGHPRNAYHSIFVSAGEKPSDFKAIWD